MKGRIGVLKGDYIGPEIINEALKVLNVVAKKYDHNFKYIKLYASGEAYDKFGVPLPEETLKRAESCDALLKGPFGGPPAAINHPKWSNIEKNTILPLRKYFNLFTNIRETKVYDSLIELAAIKNDIIRNTNILIVRELISGIYFGPKKTELIDGERVYSDTEVYSESEIRRIAKKAFEFAEKRKKKVTLVAKANILKSSELWKEVVNEIAGNYQDIKYDYLHVDNAAMQIIKDPGQFDVILTSNMFGDILSDEASVLSGSIGLQPSASLGSTKFGMYEPIHGSAPAIAGKDIANPVSAILSAALMLKYTFDLEREAKLIEKAIQNVFEKGYRTKDIYQDDTKQLIGTRAFGNLVVKEIEAG